MHLFRWSTIILYISANNALPEPGFMKFAVFNLSILGNKNKDIRPDFLIELKQYSIICRKVLQLNTLICK